jgi:integrase
MANRVAATVSQMFKFGVQRGLLNASPCVALQRPGGREKSRERILTEAEVLTVWQRLDGTRTTLATQTALRLLLITAQRRGELARAQWKDIDFTTALWTIPAEHAKNGRMHRVPLSSLALELLDELKTRGTGTVWLFPSAKQNGSAMIEQSLSRAVRNNEEHFGIPHFTLHDFRRTAASMMTMLGIPRLHVSKVLNHADEGITAVYDKHDYLPEMRKALETWADYLAAIVSGRARKVVPIDHTARERTAR